MNKSYPLHLLLSTFIGMSSLLSVTTRAQTITTVAGNGSQASTGDNGAATSASVYPERIAIDAANNIYISEPAFNRVRKVNGNTGIITTYAGNGTYTNTGDGGPATSAGLYSPDGIGLDGSGNLYIVDDVKNIIRKVTASTGIITTVAGSGTSGYSGDGGPAASAMFDGIRAIAIDANGNIYVTDQRNHCVRKITAATGVVSTVAGSGNGGNSGDGGPATSATMNDPIGLAVDASGNIYIGDVFNHVIRKVTAATGVISTIAGCPSCTGTADGSPASLADMGSPYGMRVDNAGNIYVVNFTSHVVRKISAAGTISTIAGVMGYGLYGGDGGPATSAHVNFPTDIDLDASGNIYVADRSNYRVRKVSATSTPNAVSTSVSQPASKLDIYPNPACESFTIAGVCSADASQEAIKIEMVNQLGAIVYSNTIQPKSRQWSVPVAIDRSISSGTYFVDVRTKDNHITQTIQISR